MQKSNTKFNAIKHLNIACNWILSTSTDLQTQSIKTKNKKCGTIPGRNNEFKTLKTMLSTSQGIL
uniref:Uncharacterized protein n=1 Tax=Heterorhabditis bacteriophora TaxID=37862 RepID=A0A1I7WAT5_HETBA